MAKDEENKVDADVLDSAIKTGEKEFKDEIPQEVVDANKAFDEKINSDDDSAIEEKSSDETIPEKEAAKEKAVEKKADDQTAETKDTGKEKAVEQTAEEKEIEAAAEKIEQEAIASSTAPEVKPPVKKPEVKPVVKDEADDDKPYDCGLDPNEYDEGLIKQLNQQGQAVKDAAKVLSSENAELRTVLAQQSSQRYTDWLDSQIMGLGEDFHEVFGEGEFDDIEPASVQFENRAKLSARISIISQAYTKLGKPVPSRNKLFKQALSYLHKDIVNKSKTEEETVGKLAARAGQSLGGGSNKGSALTAEQKAANVIRDFDKKLKED